MKKCNYVIVGSWWDYEPSVTPYTTRVEALKAFKDIHKDSRKSGEYFVAKIIMGKKPEEKTT